MRSVKSTHQDRSVPVGEMLGVRLGVLQRGEELQTTLQGLTILLGAGPVTHLAYHAAGFGQTLGIECRGYLGSRSGHTCIRALPKTTEPQGLARIELNALEPTEPIFHFEHKIRKGLLLGQEEGFGVRVRLPGALS